MLSTYHNEQAGNDTPEESNDGLDERLPVTKEGEDDLLEDVRRAECRRKRPAKNARHGEPKDALRGLQAAPPVHKRGGAQHAHVHGKARGQERRAGVEVARAGDGGNQEEDADPAIQSGADDLEHEGLAKSTDKGKAVADKVKLGHLERFVSSHSNPRR